MLSHVTTWVTLEDITPCEMSQSQNTHYLFLLIWGVISFTLQGTVKLFSKVVIPMIISPAVMRVPV